MQIDYTQYKFSDALLPKQFTVCGVKLKSFCLGHICLLEERKNPFINAEPVGLNHSQLQRSLFEAILVCSMTYEDAYKLLNSPFRYKLLMNLFSLNLLRVMRKNKEWNFFTEKNKFIQYMKAYLDMPIYDELHGSGQDEPSGTDWKTSILVTFQKFNLTQGEILNMSLKRLFYLWASYIESEGAVRVVNKFDYPQIIRQNAIKKKKGAG